MGTYSYSGKPVFVTVSQTGDYDIVALGAQGGSITGGAAGGYGAEVGGTVHLTAGEKLEIVVGGQGNFRTTSAAGGGGGSFVLANIGGTYRPLVVAGGGGGADNSSGGAGLTTKGNATSGSVGQGGAPGAGSFSGAGGSGFQSNGKAGNGDPTNNSFVTGGSNRTGNYAGGGRGGNAGPNFGAGGFGGGGGGYGGGGGGGGYTGGDGGVESSAGGGGGGSYDAGIPISSQMMAGENGGNGRVIISPDAVTCFVSGTRIRTACGEVIVEDLRSGDLALTASGDRRPIRWLGHKTIDFARHPRPHEALPIRISAHAFGENLPERELWLSPGHPVLVGADGDGEGGHLVPIMCLINGTTVCRVAVDTVTYWHVELDAHDILLAEGLPAESYLDWGDRAFFTENSEHALTNPDFVVPGLAGRCRPVALDGPVVEAERLRLDAVFAMRLITACDWGGAEAAPGF